MGATRRSERSVVVRSHRALALMLLLVFGVFGTAVAQNLDALLLDLRSPDESIRRAAGRSLVPVLEERYADALQGLIAAAGDRDPAVADGAVALLAIGGGLSLENATLSRAAASAYVSALDSASTATRRNAAQALGTILPHTPTTAVPALVAALEDPDPSVRRSSARGLGRLEATTSDVQTALLRILQSGAPASVRGAAAEALGSLGAGGPVVLEALVLALADADSFVRQESVGALADLAGQARGALEALEAVAAGGADPLIRELAAAAVFTIENSNTPPDRGVAVAKPDRLWPLNHELQSVAVGGVEDPDGDPVTLAITSVQQDEGVFAAGRGHVCPDAEIDGAVARLRAERSGDSDGRVYVLGFTAMDGVGESCTGQVRVCVAHDEQGSCVEGPVLADSTRCGDQELAR